MKIKLTNIKQSILVVYIFLLTVFGYSVLSMRKYLLAGGIILAMLIVLSNKKIRLRKIGGNTKIWALMCGVACAATVLADIFPTIYSSANIGLGEYIDVLKEFVLLPLVIYFFSRHTNIKAYILFFRGYALVLCLLCLIEKTMSTKLFLWLYSPLPSSAEVERVSLFLSHPIYFAVFVMLGAIALMMYPLKNTLRTVIAWILIFVGLFFSEARSTWVAFVMVAILRYLKKKKVKRSVKKSKLVAFTALVLCFLVILLSTDIIQNAFMQIFGKISVIWDSDCNDASKGIRLTNAINAIVFLGSNPRYLLIGGGYGFSLSFLLENPSLYGWTDALDNQYLSYILNFGILTFALFIILTCRCLKSVFVKNEISTEYFTLNLMLISLMISLFFFEALTTISPVFAVYISLIFLIDVCENRPNHQEVL